ncbi:MAG: carboxypeptidase regulatory-like domain-containing protein, partial [Spirochaetales bacterium]|nr:carboxypeptidase regulatory-like domain-containing protein [Spirochaetales bacterium]
MRKNRLLFLLTGIAAFALVAGCGLFVTEDALVVGGGYINGYVETQDGAPLPGVTVYYSIPDEPVDDAKAAAYAAKGTQTVVTDAAGFFEINGLIPGNYRLTFSISGYTIATDMVTLTPEGFFLVSEVATTGETETESAKYEYTDEIIVTLYAKIATAKGSVFIETARGLEPANGQTVVAMFQDRYFSSTTINASGDFLFDKTLPAGPVAFYVRSFYDGTVFYDNFWLTTISVWDPSVGETGEYVDVLGEADLSDRNEALEPAYWVPGSGTTPYVISSNLSQNFLVTQSIELTFNKPIRTADFVLYAYVDGLGALADGDPIDFAATWSGNTVTIDPSETLRSDYDYAVSYIVEADDYYVGNGDVYFRTERGIAKIGSNVEDLDETTLDDFVVTDDIVIVFNMAIDHIY